MGDVQSLKTILKAKTEFFYFEPPENTKMKYPCLLLEVNRGDTKFADNKPFLFTEGYTLTLITESVDDSVELRPEIAKLPLGITHSQHFVSDNLHHDVFSLFY